MNTINRNSNSVLKGTIIAAGTGAAVNGGANLIWQKVLLKHPATYKDMYVEVTKQISEQTPVLGKYYASKVKPIIDILDSGKVNWKMAGKAATTGAALVGGIYLAYRGIKSLFSQKN